MLSESFKDAVFQIMKKISDEIPDSHKKFPVDAYIVGGAAVHLHTNLRVSNDVDSILSNAVKLPEDLVVPWIDEDGNVQQVSYDYNYNSSFGLMQEDYDKRAVYIKTIDEKLNIYILHPIDLIISKIARFSDSDEDDIKVLIQTKNIDRDELYALAADAIKVGIGFPKSITTHLEWVMEIYDEINKTK